MPSQVKESQKLPELSSKDALLEAGARLFSEKGYRAVSTRELTEAAGVNLGSIQYHFGSKSNLFIETVRSLFLRQQESRPFFPYERASDSRSDVAVDIVFFITALLEDIFFPVGPDVCKLVNREMLGSIETLPEISEALVSTIADEFYGPADKRLQTNLSLLLPQASEDEIFLFAKSIIGQCCFYATNKAFVEHLHNRDYSTRETVSKVRENIAKFSLQGLGMSSEEITTVLRTVYKIEGPKA